jgi:hypothetical protein
VGNEQKVGMELSRKIGELLEERREMEEERRKIPIDAEGLQVGDNDPSSANSTLLKFPLRALSKGIETFQNMSLSAARIRPLLVLDSLRQSPNSLRRRNLYRKDVARVISVRPTVVVVDLMIIDRVSGEVHEGMLR